MNQLYPIIRRKRRPLLVELETVQPTPVAPVLSPNSEADSGDLLVANPPFTGLESPVNRQAGKPALHPALPVNTPEPSNEKPARKRK